MKKKPEFQKIAVAVSEYADGTFHYSLWGMDTDGNYKYVGSDGFKYATREAASEAGIRHREEICKPEEE